MTKPFLEYNLADWRRLRPVTQSYKTLRYKLVDRRYMRRPARAGDVASLARAVAGRKVLATIAYADPQAVDWQTRLVRHYLPDVVHIVADNSPDEVSAAAIAEVARARQALYIRLPVNPWHQSSRSHGIAMNWVWRNVLRPGAPEAFGFLDDDIFPTGPDEPFSALRSQDFYGNLRFQGSRWHIWAGYCSFHFGRVADKGLDFGQDWFKALDTGGGNWRALFSHVDPTAIQGASLKVVPYETGATGAKVTLQWLGTWLHETGSEGTAENLQDKRRIVAEILAPHLAAADAARKPAR
jgi:hypothetical protein